MEAREKRLKGNGKGDKKTRDIREGVKIREGERKRRSEGVGKEGNKRVKERD